MALFRRTKATKQHLAYQAYHKETKAKGGRPLTFRRWVESREPVYFRGITKKTPEARLEPFTTTRTKSVESGLKQGGLTNEEIARFRRKK